MAWRLDKSVIRGELSNEEPGRVHGMLWLVGRNEPLSLELKGNGHRDIAGCRIAFTNPAPEAGEQINLAAAQRGVVGDMTASRKVRVLDVSVEEAMRLSKEGQPVPEHRGNCLYLEWFSEANGRVVIESVDFSVEISQAAWHMNEKEERDQLVRNQQAIRDWLERLRDIEDSEVGDSEQDTYAEDEEAPMDEFQWEQFLKESDEITDRYMEVFEKYKDHPDCDRLVARDMGWTWLEEALEAEERGALEEESGDEEDEDQAIEPLVPNPLTEGVDWIRDDKGSVHHPLTSRAHRVAMAIWHQCDELALLGESGDKDVQDMIFQAQTLSAKLAGALDHLAYESEREPGFVVACLKRSLNYLHASIAASDRVLSKKSVAEGVVMPFRQNLFDIREQILHLMQRFRRPQW